MPPMDQDRRQALDEYCDRRLREGGVPTDF
jgi:hypothetical protein